MRDLYVDGSAAFEPSLLSDFGLACFMGLYEHVKMMVESGTAPDICGHETQYHHGYLTLVVSGRQRIKEATFPMQHGEVVKYLLGHGAPTELGDIAGYTGLQHTTIRAAVIDIARILLEGGANPNHQNKYGCTALMDACMTGSVSSIDLLLEFGADPDISDADGCKPSLFCLQAGPQVTAVFTKWKRKCSGAQPQAFADKQCDACNRPPVDGAKLLLCARCRTARYCNVVCQREHWHTHKPKCYTFGQSNTLILKPHYQPGMGAMFSQSSFVRKGMGLPDPFKSRDTSTGSRYPPQRELPKHLVIKVQLAMQAGAEANGDCLVYSKKRDVLCQLRHSDNGSKYDVLVRTIKAQGAGGLKAYFAAEMTRKDELIIKVGEVLAEQPF